MAVNIIFSHPEGSVETVITRALARQQLIKLPGLNLSLSQNSLDVPYLEVFFFTLSKEL